MKIVHIFKQNKKKTTTFYWDKNIKVNCCLCCTSLFEMVKSVKKNKNSKAQATKSKASTKNEENVYPVERLLKKRVRKGN